MSMEFAAGFNTALLVVIAMMWIALYMQRSYNTGRGVTETTAPTRERLMDTIRVSVPRSQLTEHYLAYRNSGYKVTQSTVQDGEVILVMVKHIGYTTR